jgi:polygalacturonase
MRRLDLLATMLTVPFALLATKSTAASEFEDFGGGSGTLRNVRGGFVNALDYGLRAGGGHGEHNAVALQRAVDDVALVGGTILIPTGRYEIASPIGLTVSSGERCTKEIAIVGARARSW